MGELAETLKSSKSVQIQNPVISETNLGNGHDKAEMKQAVRNAVQNYAEKIKEWDREIVQTTQLEKLSKAAFKTNTPKSKTGNNSSPGLVIFLFISVVLAGTLGFFFWQEYHLRNQISIELERAVGERAQVEQSARKLNTELNREQNENRAKLILIDQLRSEHKAQQIALVTSHQDQVGSLKNSIQARDQFIKKLQTELKVLRRNLDQPSDGLYAVEETDAGKTKMIPGKILSIDRRNRFIVTDLSSFQGAETGRLVDIYQDGVQKGQVRIDRIYDDLSAAVIIGDSFIDGINEGDDVFFSFS